MPPSVDIYSVETKDWWKRSEFVLYELNINSSISHPGHQEKLSIDEPYILRGYAYSGGGRKVIRVDLSFDNCKTWVDAELKYNQEAKGSKPWSWCLWQYEIKNMQSLIQTTEITVRAVDSSFNMQPSERTWNVLGMMNNSYYRVKTSPIFDNDNKCFITFTHPVVPGSNGGGWMEELTTPIKPTIQNTYFSLDEIKKHNKENDCWLIIDNEVYDVTTYMKDHPGGSDSILVYGGKDVSQVFWLVHAMDATEMKERFCIGTVMPSSSSIKNTKSDLNPKRFIKAHLIKKVNLNHDTISMRFKVGNVTGMPIGQHVLFGAMINNDYVVRPYTPTYPIHQNEDEGVLEFVIKVYKETKNKPGGKMSCYLNEMKQGDVMQVKGPTGPILYHQNGMLTIHNKSVKALQLNMIAGGTGITPMFQIIRKVLECSGDDTLIKMVYANNTLEDILLKKELEELQNKYNKQFFVWHVLMESPKDQDFKCSVGFINEDILREHLYKADENSIVLICGPPVMIEACVRPSLDNMGYTDDNVFEF
ncbi:nitrate reductase (NAD(P)H) [Acrasis kona]|uniref:Nitrate reductase (NAD(P)H) n=2 Tax=Acrasis kona TaxID=1008807 RepID=A0AAW2YU69_9EUKA